MLSPTRSVSLLGTSLLLAISVTGCFRGTPELGAVTGTVTLDGEPLAGAEVTFQPTGGSPSVATTDGAGHYELEYARDKPGAIIGSHTVRIVTQTTRTDESGNEIQVPQRVPEKYNFRSTLRRTVKTGENRFDFKLESVPEEEEPPAEEPEGEQRDTPETKTDETADEPGKAEKPTGDEPEAKQP